MAEVHVIGNTKVIIKISKPIPLGIPVPYVKISNTDNSPETIIFDEECVYIDDILKKYGIPHQSEAERKKLSGGRLRAFNKEWYGLTGASVYGESNHKEVFAIIRQPLLEKLKKNIFPIRERDFFFNEDFLFGMNSKRN